MMICVISLFLIMSSTGEQIFEDGLIIVDKSNVYLLSACDGKELIKENHNMTDNIKYVNARVFDDDFMVVFGGEENWNYGLLFIKTNCSMLQIKNFTSGVGTTSLFPINNDTLFRARVNGELSTFTISDGKNNILISFDYIYRSNFQRDVTEDNLYYLEGKPNLNSTINLIKFDFKRNSSQKINISEPVLKLEIDFKTHKIFAISKDNDLLKGKFDISNNVELQAFRNVKHKVVDFSMTPSEIYYIEKNYGSILKVKRTDDVESVPVFEKTKFDKPSAIVYLDFPGQDCEEFPKSFTTAIRSHWSFYFAMFLFTLNLWKS